MKGKYKNRESLFIRLQNIRKNLRDIVELNSDLLVGSEIAMLKAIESKLHNVTKRQKRRKENR